MLLTINGQTLYLRLPTGCSAEVIDDWPRPLLEARRLQSSVCQKSPLSDPQKPGESWFAFIEFTKAILRDFGDSLVRRFPRLPKRTTSYFGHRRFLASALPAGS